VTGQILSYAALLPDGSFGTTFHNAGNAVTYGLEWSGNYKVSSWYKMNGSVTGFQYKLDNQIEKGNNQDGFSWFAKVNAFVTLPRD